MSKLIDLSGRSFDKWEVIKRAGNISGKPGWFCRCECGTQKIVRGSNLRGASLAIVAVSDMKKQRRGIPHMVNMGLAYIEYGA